MGCGISTPAASEEDISRPTVTRSPASSVTVLDEQHLPLGVKLTGAERLHTSLGLRGQGVKVAVIDSGIDATHPSFHGKVVKKTWYRSGTPLTEDDHG
jgi:subtilisin family serine protease